MLSAISTFCLLKLAILFSTGLLVPEQVPVTTAVPSIKLNLLGGASASPNSAGIGYYSDRLFADIASNLIFPSGVTIDAAFQEMSNDNEFPPQSVATAQVFGFFPDLKCEEATINGSYGMSYIVGGSSGTPNAPSSLSLQSAACNETLAYIQPVCSYASWTDCKPEFIYSSSTSTVYCESFNEGTNSSGQENALVFMLMKVAKDPGSKDTGESKASWTSAVLCRTTYAIETADLSVDTQNPYYPGGKTISDPVSRTRNQIAGCAPSNLTSDFSWEINFISLAENFSKLIPATYSSVDYSNLDLAFQLMLAVTKNFDLESLGNTSTLAAATTKVFKALSVRKAGTWLSFPNHLTTGGSYVSPGQKLFVQDSATWEMCTVLGIAILAVLSLIIVARHYPERPASLVALAASANKDSKVVALLRTMGHNSDKQLSGLSLFKFTSSRDSHGQPQLLTEDDQHPSGDQEKSSYSHRYNVQWSMPLSARRWFTAACILVPLTEIAILEFLSAKVRRTQRHMRHDFVV